MNRKEAYIAMLDGKRVRHNKWPKDCYCHYNKRLGILFTYNYKGHDEEIVLVMDYEEGYEEVKRQLEEGIVLCNKGVPVYIMMQVDQAAGMLFQIGGTNRKDGIKYPLWDNKKATEEDLQKNYPHYTIHYRDEYTMTPPVIKLNK